MEWVETECKLFFDFFELFLRLLSWLLSAISAVACVNLLRVRVAGFMRMEAGLDRFCGGFLRRFFVNEPLALKKIGDCSTIDWQEHVSGRD